MRAKLTVGDKVQFMSDGMLDIAEKGCEIVRYVLIAVDKDATFTTAPKTNWSHPWENVHIKIGATLTPAWVAKTKCPDGTITLGNFNMASCYAPATGSSDFFVRKVILLRTGDEYNSRLVRRSMENMGRVRRSETRKMGLVVESESDREYYAQKRPISDDECDSEHESAPKRADTRVDAVDVIEEIVPERRSVFDDMLDKAHQHLEEYKRGERERMDREVGTDRKALLLQAKGDAETIIMDAHREAVKIIDKARADAAKITADAQAEEKKIIDKAHADASKITDKAQEDATKIAKKTNADADAMKKLAPYATGDPALIQQNIAAAMAVRSVIADMHPLGDTVPRMSLLQRIRAEAEKNKSTV